MSQRQDVEKVVKNLDEGKKLFENLLCQHNCNSDNFKDFINDSLKLAAERQGFMPNDDKYMPYIKSLQMKYRLSPRDLKTLFGDEDIIKYTKCGHMSEDGIENLKESHYLLDGKTLAVIYPWELFAQHLQLFSKYCGYVKQYAEGQKLSQQADVVYASVKEHCGVALLGMYINKRFLLNLQTELKLSEALDDLCSNWKVLREERSEKVYESGIVRSLEMSEDEYHQLICLEGELLVYGHMASRTSDVDTRKNLIAKGDDLVKKIKELCDKHHQKHITRSRAYIEVSKFYNICADYQVAMSYLVQSMMENHLYWLDKQSLKEGHPELDEDKISRFYTILKDVESCLKSYEGNSVSVKRGMILDEDEKKYLENVRLAWQEKHKESAGSRNKDFEAIDKILQLCNQQTPGVLLGSGSYSKR